MNPQHNESAGMQLPPPVMEQAPNADLGAESQAGKKPEKAQPAGAERSAAGPSQPAAMPAIPLPTPPVMPLPSQNGAVNNTTAASAQLMADDSDLIEKEWVNKAKQIVERTRDDPYRQSEQLTEVKVDYMQKRYGKTIKLSK